MNKKNPLIIGTLILTATGFLNKIIGFFFRIFLSRTIGAEGMGIYQMVFPLFAFFHSISCAGIEIAISKYVAEEKKKEAKFSVLACGCIISISLASVCALCMFYFSNEFATYVLNETKTAPLLQALSYALIFSVIHSCISGYYIGQKKTLIPGISSLIEQIVRTITVYTIINVLTEQQMTISPIVAIYGTIAGEIASSLFTFSSLRLSRIHLFKKHSITYFRKIIKMAMPITFNSAMMTSLLSVEAILIPFCLKQYGHSGSESLMVYGILTGMAIPLVMFPASFITSMSMLVLPTISEASNEHKNKKITDFIEKILSFCLISGIFSTFIFISYGNTAGYIIFKIRDVSTFITILAWLCPFIYLSINFKSIINGLGDSKITFIHNIITISIKILFTIIFVPLVGIKGYLWGLLASQILLCLLHYRYLFKKFTINLNPIKNIVMPVIFSIISFAISKPFYIFTAKMTGHLSYPAIIIPCFVCFIAYLLICKLFLYNN
ncbi:MAG: polysaccharide biosynthesis protein [Lachnospiraceae bacterium]|nr:polysaccharide biosynthesis protein [Lachnospiraceae bacterium]